MIINIRLTKNYYITLNLKTMSKTKTQFLHRAKARKEARKLAQKDIQKENLNFFFNGLFEDYSKTMINLIERNES